MESMSREFALFIDGIRIERGISRLDLIDGIISLSQYKRYLRGVTAIPNDIILEIASRLKYSITDLYSLYTRKHSKEDTLIREVYNELRIGRFQEAYEKLSNLNPESFVSEYYKTSYDFCMIYVQHSLNRVSDIHVLQMYSELINFPECMNNDSFNFVEISTLTQIIRVSSTINNFDAANKLYAIMSSGKFNYSTQNENSLIPVLYYTIAIVFYKQDEYEKAIELASQGIQSAIKNENTNALPQIYMLDAFAKKNLDNLDEAYLSVKKCFMLLILTENKNAIESFKVSYYKVFDLPLEELMQDVYKML